MVFKTMLQKKKKKEKSWLSLFSLLGQSSQSVVIFYILTRNRSPRDIVFKIYANLKKEMVS